MFDWVLNRPLITTLWRHCSNIIYFWATFELILNIVLLYIRRVWLFSPVDSWTWPNSTHCFAFILSIVLQWSLQQKPVNCNPGQSTGFYMNDRCKILKSVRVKWSISWKVVKDCVRYIFASLFCKSKSHETHFME